MKTTVSNKTSSQCTVARLSAGLAMLLLFAPAAFAASQWFSGTAAWDATTTANWSAAPNGPYTSLWTSGNSAVFEGTAGTVTVSGTDIPTCGGITFSNTGYALNGGQIKIVNNSTIKIATASQSATVTSVIADSSGASAVTFAGASFSDTLFLGDANTFTGQANVQAVTLQFTNLQNGGVASSFGQGASTVGIQLGAGSASSAGINYYGNGGSTDRPILVGGSATGGACSINNNGFGAIGFNNTGNAVFGTVGNRGLTLNGNYTATASTFAGALTNMTGKTTTLTVAGATWNILGTNSHGSTVLSGGTLQLTNEIALGSPGSNNVTFSGGTLAAINLGAPVQNDVTISASRTMTVITNKTASFKTPDTNNLILAGYITGAGHVSKASTSYTLGTVRFSNDTNDFTGTFTAGFGNTEFTSVANSGTPSALGLGLTNSGAIILANSSSTASFSYVGANNSSTTRPLSWTGHNGIFLGNNGSGTVSFLSSSSLRSTDTGAAALNLNGTNAGANTLAQVINDNTGVTTVSKSDSGQWVLSGANTYSGVTTVSGGTLSINSDGNLGAVPGSATPGSVVLNGGTLSAFTSVTPNANRGIAVGPTSGSGSGGLDAAAGQTLTYAGIVANNGSGTGGLTKGTNSGTVTISGANTYTGGTTVSGGTLNVYNDQSAANGGWTLNANTSAVNFNAGSLVYVTTGKSVTVGGSASTGNTLAVAGTVTNDGAMTVNRRGTLNLNNGANWTQTGAVTIIPSFLSGYSAYLNINSGATLAYTGAGAINVSACSSNGGWGVLNIAGGTLVTGQGFTNSTVTSTGAGNIAFSTNGTLKLSASIPDLYDTAGSTNSVTLGTGGGTIDTAGFSTTLGTIVSGSGSLTKAGAGTLTLAGANTYTGNTIINGGTLELVQPALAAASTVAVASGAVLHLDFAVTNTVASLVLNGVSQPPGVYNSANKSPYLAGTGSLLVPSAGPSGPAFLTNSVSGGSLSLSWPAGQGWRLQMQTNSLSVGLRTNWVYATDGSISSTNIPIDHSKPTVFYRLTYP